MSEVLIDAEVAPIVPHHATYGEMIRDGAARFGDKVAMICGGRQTSYADLDRRSDQIAAGLSRLGCGKGALIGILARNCDIYIELMAAISKVGGVAVTLNWRNTAHEFKTLSAQIDFDLIFASDEFHAHVALLGVPLIRLGTEQNVSTEYQELVQTASDALADEVVGPDDPFCLMFTSGTTGQPKGVPVTNFALLYGLAMSGEAEQGWGPNSEDVTMLTTPLFHLAGLGWSAASLLTGGTLIILPRPETDIMVEAVARFGVTRAVFLPAQMPMLLERARQGVSLTSLRLISYGASSIPPQLLRQMIDTFSCGFLQKYGMSEVSGGVARLDPVDHYPDSPWLESCGRPYRVAELRIVDDAGHDCAPGKIGEILIRMPSVMRGYWNNPEATAAAIEDGWYKSGDMGYLAEQGYLFICDRKKDMIISGGENLFPAEIEAAISSHPAVRQVAVIGVPSEKWGEEAKAIVVPKTSAPISPAILQDHLRTLIAGYKIPKSYEFVADLPMTATSKVAKHELRARYGK
jgi:acyl-CoA synthetase (AMP-forming)/AMP-acid ligase II